MSKKNEEGKLFNGISRWDMSRARARTRRQLDGFAAMKTSTVGCSEVAEWSNAIVRTSSIEQMVADDTIAESEKSRNITQVVIPCFQRRQGLQNDTRDLERCPRSIRSDCGAMMLASTSPTSGPLTPHICLTGGLASADICH